MVLLRGKKPRVGDQEKETQQGYDTKWFYDLHHISRGLFTFFGDRPKANRKAAAIPVVRYTGAAFSMVGATGIRAQTLFDIRATHVFLLNKYGLF
jgi:hypothetical protein